MTKVLGYQRFAVQGGDWGRDHRAGRCPSPTALIGIHLNFVGRRRPADEHRQELTTRRKCFSPKLDQFRRDETGYQQIQGTKPQTLAYALNDSPAGLAAWIVEKFRTWSDCDGDVERRFTKDQLLTNVMIYWVTESINSSTPAVLRAAPSSWQSRAPTRESRRPPRSRFSPGIAASAAELGRARLQPQALDGDAVGRPFRRDGRAGAAGRGHPRVFPRSELDCRPTVANGWRAC